MHVQAGLDYGSKPVAVAVTQAVLHLVMLNYSASPLPACPMCHVLAESGPAFAFAEQDHNGLIKCACWVCWGTEAGLSQAKQG